MINFLPDTFETAKAAPYGEAVARLDVIHTALSVAEQVAGVVPADAPPAIVTTVWPPASAARQRCFEARSSEAAQAAAAGLEMLAAQRAAGAEAHPKSVERLALTLRTELADLDRLFSL